ncbi:glycosyltransferase family 4 protein [Pseudoalteromonas sp. HL-AS2]|uniref:glycosyltransferase family 4 protein n=1 Tax=Pseudoalteromonas sp. HL-AS2 TaxID=3071082 RepID=UPI0028155739|nr:glycosyltransferase family 4 protein [Pseudoalteromonas sp. HL-AS2]WMS94901.1 glycosyltransferase family 4 protein [Pseudoalteromonas sp. HL-AS2]
MKKIAFITASPMTVKAFLLPFIKEIEKSYEIHVISNWHGDEDFLPANVKMIRIQIQREPSIFDDLVSLIKLVGILKVEKYDIVHTFTPKAGFIGQIAAWLSRVELRFHTFTGQVWATQTGFKRFLLKSLDKLTASFTTSVLVDSPSQQSFLIKNKIVTAVKSGVLGKGSISGVNLSKFQFSQEKRDNIRAELQLKDGEFVFLYAGRLKKDKGIPELLSAYRNVAKKVSAVLVIVGADEDGLLSEVNHTDGVIFCGFTDDIVAYFSAADLLCLPSHREGFGNVVIEAAACGLPTLASLIYGLSDAIVDNETGVLHQVEDAADIEEKMLNLCQNKELLKRMSERALKRVHSEFSERLIVDEFIKFYEHEQSRLSQ